MTALRDAECKSFGCRSDSSQSGFGHVVVRSLITAGKSTPGRLITGGVMVLSTVVLRRMMVFSGVMPRCEERDSWNGFVLASQGRTSRSPTPSSRQGRDDPPRRNGEW